MPSKTSITHKNCETGYLLETSIIKITEPLRSCMHHPWDSSIWNKASGKNPETRKSLVFFPLLETLASSDFAPVLCCALCQGFFVHLLIWQHRQC